MLNYKTGHFLINEETSKAPAILSNGADRLALFHLWDQKPYQDVTQSLRRKTVLKEQDMEYYTPFTDFLKAGNRRISVTENKIRYKKTAKGETHFRIIQTVTGTPGIRNEYFNVIFNTDAFKPGDKIGPVDGLMYLAVVQSLPRPIGGNFEYTLASLNSNPDTIFPLSFLRQNTRWRKRGSSNYSEASLDWGSMIWDKGHAVLEWEVGLFRTGKEFKITDDALNHVWTMDPCDKNGNPLTDMSSTFISKVEMKMLNEVEREMEEDFLWSQYNYTIPDTSTRKVRNIGAGAFDFVKDGNVYDYNPDHFNIRELADLTTDTWYNDWGTIIWGTGRPGLELASDSIEKEFGNLAVIRDYEHYIERTGFIVPGGREAWKLKKPMFNAYELPTGGVIQFDYWPWLDDRSNRTTVHPRTGKPLLGYHFFGTRITGGGTYGDGQGLNSNIVLVDKAGAEIWGYEAGAVGPYSPINDKAGGKYTMTHSGRYATLRHGNQYGLFVEDINDFIWYRPNIV